MKLTFNDGRDDPWDYFLRIFISCSQAALVLAQREICHAEGSIPAAMAHPPRSAESVARLS
jgi:hypothetical protein